MTTFKALTRFPTPPGFILRLIFWTKQNRDFLGSVSHHQPCQEENKKRSFILSTSSTFGPRLNKTCTFAFVIRLSPAGRAASTFYYPVVPVLLLRRTASSHCRACQPRTPRTPCTPCPCSWCGTWSRQTRTLRMRCRCRWACGWRRRSQTRQTGRTRSLPRHEDCAHTEP